MKKITLGVSGMSCSACSNGLEKHLNKQSGIISAEVNLVMANAAITYDENLLDMKKIESFIKGAGFKSTGLFDMNKADGKPKPIYPLIIFAVLTLVLMYASMGHMINLPIFKFMHPEFNAKGYAISLIVLVVPFFIFGIDILVNGIKSLIRLSPNMDTLVTLGVISSFVFSVVYTVLIFKGESHLAHSLYFESSATVIFFVKLGRRIDSSSKAKTRQAIKDLVQITPQFAFVIRGGVEVKVTIDEIVVGDVVACHAGEKFAVDGVVTLGSAHVDETFITGESKPVLKKVGSSVVAGSINYDGYIEYTAEKIGKNSTVSEIVKMVVEASNTKMPIAKTADKVCGVFVPTVMALSVLTFLGYLIFGGGITLALKTFVTVLVVACPCALGLATPLAVVVGEGISAKRGILVKNSKTMEIGSKATVVVFDKTGTLTYGKLSVATMRNFSDLTDEELYKIVCSIEEKSSHPIATAFRDKAKSLGITISEITDLSNLSGYGMTAKIGEKKYLVGNAKILDKFGVKNQFKAEEESIAEMGNSIVYLADEERVLALFGVNDVVREDAKDLILSLKKRNVKSIMLTGDNEFVANIVAKQLGIDEVVFGVLPSGKAEYIKNLKKSGEIVVMCGDGINDSPALTNADIGVSVSGGTDVAIDSADVVLLGDNILKLNDFLTICHGTLKTIRQNLFWAFFYNALMIPIAMGALSFVGVVINPMLASIAMVLSSLTVIFNTLRLKLISKKFI